MVQTFNAVARPLSGLKKDSSKAAKKPSKLEEAMVDNTSNAKLLYESAYAKITMTASTKGNEHSYLSLIWNGDVSDEQYKFILNMLLELSQTHNTSRLLINALELGQISMFARAWLMLDWIPRAQKADFTSPKLVILRNESPLHKIGLDYVVSYLQQLLSYECRFYVTLDKAQDWLLLSENNIEEEVDEDN